MKMIYYERNGEVVESEEYEELAEGFEILDTFTANETLYGRFIVDRLRAKTGRLYIRKLWSNAPGYSWSECEIYL